MTRMTGPDCVVMCNLINTHTHTHTHTWERERGWRPVEGHKMGTGMGAGAETRAVAEMGTGTRMGRDGNKDGIWEGRGGVKEREKPHNNCRRDQAL